MTSRLESYFRDYDAFHQTVGNERCHYFGIPLIVVSVFGLLATFGIPQLHIDAGLILWAAAVLWYFTLSWKLALPFAFVSLAGYFLGRALPIPVLWVLFVGGWILQGIGHAKYEKKSPAFFQNVTHLLIGPLWIFARITGFRS